MDEANLLCVKHNKTLRYQIFCNNDGDLEFWDHARNLLKEYLLRKEFLDNAEFGDLFASLENELINCNIGKRLEALFISEVDISSNTSHLISYVRFKDVVVHKLLQTCSIINNPIPQLEIINSDIQPPEWMRKQQPNIIKICTRIVEQTYNAKVAIEHQQKLIHDKGWNLS